MAKNMQPIAKRCHALGISPAVMGYAKKTTNRNPGGQMRKKKSEYALQLAEKQKVKFVYGIMERQFRSYYEKASRMAGKTGENLLILVERRLDNVVYLSLIHISKKNLHKIALNGTTIPHAVVGKFGAGQVLMRPAPEGTGVIAGGAVRAVLEVAGIKDIRTKCQRTNNPCNVVTATMNGLLSLMSAEQVAAKRGKTVQEILG